MREMRANTLLAAAAVLALGAVQLAGGAPAAQNPPPAPERRADQPIFRAGTSLVRVDVSVTGRGDAAVADLTAADFDVEEDGVPQRVEQAQFVRVTGERTSDTNEPLEIRSREHAMLEASREDVRIFAIFLDDYHVDKRPDITLPIRDALAKFVEQFGPNDLVIVMTPLTTLDGLTYTRSKPELVARMRAFEGRRGEPYPVRSAVEEAQVSQRNWMELRGGVTLGALTALATHLGGLREGRKSILFVSQGPPVGLPGSPNEDRLREALQAANRGNVTIHVLDPRPLGFVRFGGADVLRRIAAETGGRAIVGTNDPTEQLKNVIADASAYYLLGYTPTRTVNDGKFHRIAVRVKRRGVDVTARRGYWAPSEKELTAAAEAAAAPPNTALLDALADLSDIETGGRPVAMWIGTSRGAARLTKVAIRWERPSGVGSRPSGVGTPDLHPAQSVARLQIEPIGPDGKPAMSAQAIAASPGELPTLAEFEFAPGRQRVRFTAQSAEGDIVDQWSRTLDVPSLSGEPLALATPRFLRARSALELRTIEQGAPPSPTATARFRPTERVVVDVECYAAPATTPDFDVELLNSRGDLLRRLDAPPPANGRLRLPLPVGSLAPSVYVLRIRASAGEHRAEQLVAFRVAP
jgi:VWFA-related protein